MKTDISIANEANMMPIKEIASKLGINEKNVELYGDYKCKINLEELKSRKDKKDGKLILVTAINPTPAGEGKTTTNIGLSMGLNKIGKSSISALREPSLGPCFGVKGGAAGGGYSQVVPMEDINLHFTGDLHAITSANNLISAILDNHIYQGNSLDIDTRRVVWKRVVDLNDRALRNIILGLKGPTNGVPREGGFDITVASEIMAILCLATDLSDLKSRIAKIIVAYNKDKNPIKVEDLGCTDAAVILLKDAIKPNLVQTLENTPAIIHGGPFANIAHGCNSVLATKMALKLSDYVVTEAGFGADLGAEKFLDIKCQMAGLNPNVVVIVATIRALKMHGGMKKEELDNESLDALSKGLENLEKHIENMKKYNIPSIIAVNKFPTDTDAEINLLIEKVENMGCNVSLSEVWAKGSEGAIDLAQKVADLADNNDNKYKPLYTYEQSIKEKIESIAKEIYGAKSVEYSSKAEKAIKQLTDMNLDKLAICMAKTQYSFSDNPKLLGRPTDFEINIADVIVSNGAGFLVVLTGDIMRMPGLPKVPAANKMTIDDEGNIEGLF